MISDRHGGSLFEIIVCIDNMTLDPVKTLADYGITGDEDDQKTLIYDFKLNNDAILGTSGLFNNM